jgi:hypothetical protein
MVYTYKWRSYPNPVSNLINMNLPASLGQYRCTLSNSWGIVVSKRVYSEGQKTVAMDVSHLPAGTYFLSLTKDGYTDSKIIIIE